jgi:AraC-like DNA-binding protein
LAQGDVLVLNTEGRSSLEITGDGELLFASFSVLAEHMFPLFSPGEITQLPQLLASFVCGKTHVAGSPLAVKCHRLVGSVPPQLNLDHRAHLMRVVAAILGEEFTLIQPGQSGFVSAEEHLMQVFEKLSANDLLTLSTEELAVKFGCSRRHLSRLFHQYFGFSMAELRMELRMLRAITLLRDANAKVVSVAEQCGFNHMGLFNTCFKRRFGTSPGRWRALGLQTAAPDARRQAESEQACLLESNGICPMFGIPPTQPAKSLPTQSSDTALCAMLKQTMGGNGFLPPQCLPLAMAAATVERGGGHRSITCP